jgi:predicted Zn finger-like uncharacterized protein
MILTCPECASRYFVDDARVGPKGRSVRCASCGHTWRTAGVEVETTIALTAPGVDVVPDARDAPLPERIRAEALEKKKTRQAVAAGVAWASLGAGFIVLALAAVLFRVDVVRLFPKTASAYAFAKMPVNPTGLALENVQGQPNLIGGRAALSVTGLERNVEAGPRSSMPLRVVLYDKSGKRITSAVAAPPAKIIAPGDTRPFAVTFIDPPSNLSDFVVQFAFDKVALTRPPPEPKHGPAAKGPQKPSVVGAGGAGGLGPEAGSLTMRRKADLSEIPVPGPPAVPSRAAEARALPSNSPYALPPGALSQSAH